MGMEVESTEGGSVYLRGWGDYQRWTLKLTESNTSGLRGDGAARLGRRRRWSGGSPLIERSGYGEGWIDGDVGHGPAYRFRDPDGHVFEIFHEVERYTRPST